MDNISNAAMIGVDVQLTRGFAYAVMDANGVVVQNGWLSAENPAAAAAALVAGHPGAVVGIDAPRMPLPGPRQHYWDGRDWRRRRASDKGFGRHCEVVVAACGLARPQWTPLEGNAPPWMRQGFALYASLRRLGIRTEEVFPSASYRMLTDDHAAQVTMPLHGFLPGPKDMLDAVVAAYSLREYRQGRGCAVGGGDGLGTIVLPRPIDEARAGRVVEWPSG